MPLDVVSIQRWREGFEQHALGVEGSYHGCRGVEPQRKSTGKKHVAWVSPSNLDGLPLTPSSRVKSSARRCPPIWAPDNAPGHWRGALPFVAHREGYAASVVASGLVARSLTQAERGSDVATILAWTWEWWCARASRFQIRKTPPDFNSSTSLPARLRKR